MVVICDSEKRGNSISREYLNATTPRRLYWSCTIPLFVPIATTRYGAIALTASPRKKVASEWCVRPMTDSAIECWQTRAELVCLLVTTHDNVQSLSAQHQAVSESVELCRGGDEGWILALHPYLFSYTNVMVSVFECAVGFVVRRRSCSTKRRCEGVAKAEAGER